MKYFVFAVVASLTLLNGCDVKEKSRYEVLQEIASDFNRECPMQLGSETRLDSVRAVSNGVIRFNQTIWLDTFTYDIRATKSELMRMATDQLKTAPDHDILQKASATVEYSYSDTTGNHLFSFAVTPDKYHK